MIDSFRTGSEYLSRHDMSHNGLLSGRTSFDDCSPSQDISILSEDYLSETSSRTSTMSRLTRPLRNVDYSAVALILSNWSFTTFRLLIPSFLYANGPDQERKQTSLPTDLEQCRAHPNQVSQANENISITCLDGLRGVACFFVFNFHFLYPFTNTILNGYGAPRGEGLMYDHIHQLPFLSLPYRGRAMVAVFFAISGYVLSLKFLMGVRSGFPDMARRILTSSVFRRALRLYLPPTVSMFVVMMLAYNGIFQSEKQIRQGSASRYFLGSWEEHPPQFESLDGQLLDWYRRLVDWINPFVWKPYLNFYDPHTWTIPLEFRGSIVLFATLLGTANLKTKWRLITTSSLVYYCLKMGRWDVALFLGGMLICELDLVSGSRSPPIETDDDEKLRCVKDPNGMSTFARLGVTALKCTILMAGLYLLSTPDDQLNLSPGYRTIASFTPEIYGQQFLIWHALGAMCTVWAVTNVSILRAIFECRLCQYLGKISYAFYLVHGPILHSVGFRLMPRIWDRTGAETDEKFMAGLAIGWCVLVILSIWCADLFWRFVDVPSTKLARKIERTVSRAS